MCAKRWQPYHAAISALSQRPVKVDMPLVEGERSNLDIALTLASEPHASIGRERQCLDPTPRLGYHCDIGVTNDAGRR